MKKKLLALATAAVAIGGSLVLMIQPAHAVFDDGAFQLDANAQASVDSYSPPASDDADLVCKANPTSVATPNGCPAFQTGLTPAGTLGANLAADAPGGQLTASAWSHGAALNASLFTGGGSKDPSDITGWSWKANSGGLPSKDALLDGFAVRYNLPSTGASTGSCPAGVAPKCSPLYFGSDRFDNSGDAQEGFWFFQNPVVAKSDGTFVDGRTGLPAVHKVGDVLLLSDFSNGGGTAFIQVFKWVGTGGDTNGSLQSLSPFPTKTNLGGALCGLTAAPKFCGITNPANGTPAPWAFTDKGNNTTFQTGELYKGGINLSDPGFGLGSECFSSFLSETRSSVSPTAVLKDFILGAFAPCTATTVSTPKDAGGNSISGKSVSIGSGSVSVKDSATVTATGSSTAPTGSVDFQLCSGPSTPAITTCTAGAANAVDLGSVGLDGVSNPSTVTSSTAAITSVGSYCFIASYSGDGSYPKSNDHSSGECFTVTPVPTDLTTTASSGPVALGTSIDDAATLSGAANEPGSPIINPSTPGKAAAGTITFTLFGPNDSTCASGAIETSTVTVSGNGMYNASSGTLSGSLGSTKPAALTPKSAGTYYWIANYGGDSPNTLANPVNGCNDTHGSSVESVVVNPNQPTISTSATSPPPAGSPLGTQIDDTAVLLGTAKRADGTAAQGTITFKLYGPSDTAVCTPTDLVETSVVNVLGDSTLLNVYKASGGTLSGTLGTTLAGGALTPTLPGTYWWTASYSGDLPNTLGVSEGCGGSNGDVESSLLIQLQPTIGTTQSFVPNDSAEIRAPSGAGALAGHVEFKLFIDNTACDATVSSAAYDSGSIDITTGTGSSTDKTVTTSNTTAYNTNGTTTFSWLVTYTSTNPGQKNVSSTCNTENSSLTIGGNGPAPAP